MLTGFDLLAEIKVSKTGGGQHLRRFSTVRCMSSNNIFALQI